MSEERKEVKKKVVIAGVALIAVIAMILVLIYVLHKSEDGIKIPSTPLIKSLQDFPCVWDNTFTKAEEKLSYEAAGQPDFLLTAPFEKAEIFYTKRSDKWKPEEREAYIERILKIRKERFSEYLSFFMHTAFGPAYSDWVKVCCLATCDGLMTDGILMGKENRFFPDLDDLDECMDKFGQKLVEAVENREAWSQVMFGTYCNELFEHYWFQKFSGKTEIYPGVSMTAFVELIEDIFKKEPDTAVKVRIFYFLVQHGSPAAFEWMIDHYDELKLISISKKGEQALKSGVINEYQLMECKVWIVPPPRLLMAMEFSHISNSMADIPRLLKALTDQEFTTQEEWRSWYEKQHHPIPVRKLPGPKYIREFKDKMSRYRKYKDEESKQNPEVKKEAEKRKLSNQFSELLKPSVKYSKYITKRDQFLSLDGAEDYLKQQSKQKRDITAQILAYALGSMIKNKEQHDKVREKFGKSIDFLTKPVDKKTITYSPHVRPDPTRKPMFSSFKCRENVEEYIKHEEEHWKKHGSPFVWQKALGLKVKEWTREEYIENERRRWWDFKTPCLGPAMCEIAVKGWNDEANIQILKGKGYGEDFYRYMAVHLLGELKYKKAADYLLERLKDTKEDEYLRAHAARALLKICDPEYLEDLFVLVYIDTLDFSKVIWREIKWECFPKKEVVKTIKNMLSRTKSAKIKMKLLYPLTDSFHKTDADVQKEVISVLEGLCKDSEVYIRLRAKDLLNRLSPPLRRSEDEKTKNARLKYSGTLERIGGAADPLNFSNVFHGDQEYKLFNLMRGESNKKDAEELTSFYLGFIDYFAKAHEYTDANVFATKELHNYKWPGNVIDYDPKSFFMNMLKLKKGMTKEEVMRAGKPKLKEVEKKEIPGTSLEYVKYKREFRHEVECNYGVRANSVTIEMVFYQGKLQIIHDRKKR